MDPMMTADSCEQEWVPPKMIAHADLTRMAPATAGANRGGLPPLADYIGGRLHGQSTMPGFHALFRDEHGHDLDSPPIPPNYYRLYVDGVCLHYVHSSLLPSENDSASAE